MYRKDLRWCRRRILNQKGYGLLIERQVQEASSGGQLWSPARGASLGSQFWWPSRERDPIPRGQIGIPAGNGISGGHFARPAREERSGAVRYDYDHDLRYDLGAQLTGKNAMTEPNSRNPGRIVICFSLLTRTRAICDRYATIQH